MPPPGEDAGGGSQMGSLSATVWRQRGNILLFFLWLAIVVYLTANHVMWRDEVRALSFATYGDTLSEMFRKLQGDGHPLLWFLLLRAGNAVAGPIALPVIAFVVGCAAVILLIWRSPFIMPTKILIVFSNFALFEYVVMARNYGIAMLLMFAFAACYPRYREKGLWLVVPLMLLSQTHAHALIYASLLTGYWLVDIRTTFPDLKSWAIRRVLPVAILMALAALVCLVTIWPPNSRSTVTQALETPPEIWKGLVFPGYAFIGKFRWDGWLLSFALFASLLALVRQRWLFLAGLVSLLSISLFFMIVYPGYQRHLDLWLVFLLTLWWLSYSRFPARSAESWWETLRRLGIVAVHCLLIIEVAVGAKAIADHVEHPRSRAKDLAELVGATRGLQDAIIIADPDTSIDTLPYYLPNNPLYRIRSQEFGPLVDFYEPNNRHIDLPFILATARRLQAETGREVVILLRRLPDLKESTVTNDSSDWTTSTTPAQAAAFYRSTRLLTRFEKAGSNESYAVFVLD